MELQPNKNESCCSKRKHRISCPIRRFVLVYLVYVYSFDQKHNAHAHTCTRLSGKYIIFSLRVHFMGTCASRWTRRVCRLWTKKPYKYSWNVSFDCYRPTVATVTHFHRFNIQSIRSHIRSRILGARMSNIYPSATHSTYIHILRCNSASYTTRLLVVRAEGGW